MQKANYFWNIFRNIQGRENRTRIKAFDEYLMELAGNMAPSSENIVKSFIDSHDININTEKVFNKPISIE